LFLGGSSGAAQRVAARHVDVFLTWGDRPPQLAELIARVRVLAAAHGRTVRFGTRFHVITRDTADEAWAEANGMLAGLDADLIAKTQQRFGRTESIGQRRMAALHGGRTENLEVYPNLWAGYGLVRQGAGTALVGSHEEVADRLAEYHALGVDHVILSGQPHLEEAYEVGEGLMPILRRRGLLSEPAELVASSSPDSRQGTAIEGAR
jgi:alkanesulfonate monooxygenase